IALSGCEEIKCLGHINGGILAAAGPDGEMLLCRFSMKHMVRMSYLARGATLFIRGDYKLVESGERETHCPRCGKALRGVSACADCDGGRGRAFRRFWDLCRRYALPLMLITVFMAAISGLTVFQQYINERFIDDVLVPAAGGWAEIGAFFAATLTVTLLSLALSVARTLWGNSLGTRISRDLRTRVFEKINLLSLSFLDTRQAGELMNRVVHDARHVRQFMEEVFGGMFTQLFTMIMATVTMLTMDWKLALLTVSLAPLAAVLIRVFRRQERRLWRQQWRYNDRVNTRLQDVISGIRVVKSFGCEESETERFRGYTERLAYIQSRNEIFWATLYPVVTFLLTTGSFFVLYYGGREVLGGNMTIGQLTRFAACAGMLYGPLGWLTRLPRMIMQLTTSLGRMYEILEEEPDVGDAPDAAEHELGGHILFENMHFGYKSYEPVLEQVNLEVQPGEMIGLVGPSGAGKSTMINLIMRLYDVDDGWILADGMDLRDIKREHLHSQIGVVLQETFLFTGTIYDNIRFAKPEAAYEEIIRAAKMANAHDFIVKFSDGYNTYVGEHGYTLSGGERQRIAIARAILHNPRLLILDEATSSLDTETEFQIQQALERLTEGRTTFAIAHRLSTLRGADRIVVIDQHKIAEVGTHNELMRKKGIYYGLVMAQLEMHKTK
ncbi:MAG: ABC transporter ATP-binding protein/permease, partial [Oscillospiraceae bacterium]|nr:ABC transporter ATP-binding protein/permease [Oscillospiraceae bacterium]